MLEVLSSHLFRQFLVVCIRYPILSFGATWIAPRMLKVSHARMNATATMGLGQIVQKLLVGLLSIGPPFARELELRSRTSNFREFDIWI